MKISSGFLCITFFCVAASLTEVSGQTSRRAGPDISLGSRRNSFPAHSISKTTVVEPIPAGTYTIGVGGNFGTIDSAFSRLNAGGIGGPVTFLLKDTQYVAPSAPGDFRLVGPIAGTGPSSRIIIRPADNVAVTIRGSGTATLTLENVSYLTLDGISREGNTRLKVHTLVNPAYPWSDAIDVWGDCDHNIIRNLTARSDRITDLYTSAVLLYSNDVAAPDSCLIFNVSIPSGAIGIFVGGYAPYNARPRGNVIQGCHIGSPVDTLISRGIMLDGADGTIVENNQIENLRLGLAESPGSGPSVFGINPYFTRNTAIRNNIIHGLRGSDGANIQAIMASGNWENAQVAGRNIRIYNNMVYDLTLYGAVSGYIGGIGVWRTDTVLVAHNTVRLEGTVPVGVGTDALAFDRGLTNATVRNNILVNLYRGGGNSAFWFDALATFTSDYNDLFVDTTVVTSSTVACWPSPSYRLLSDWQATGKDLHSVSVAPSFKSATDLHLSFSLTRLADAATPLASITTDIDGDIRPTPGHPAPDMGADEFAHPTTGVDEQTSGFPVTCRLEQNYPNPFNPTTTVRFTIGGVVAPSGISPERSEGGPASALVRLSVYDLLGREVALLVNEKMDPGNYVATWDAGGMASGVYFYRIQSGEFIQSRKMVLMR